MHLSEEQELLQKAIALSLSGRVGAREDISEVDRKCQSEHDHVTPPATATVIDTTQNNTVNCGMRASAQESARSETILNSGA